MQLLLFLRIWLFNFVVEIVEACVLRAIDIFYAPVQSCKVVIRMPTVSLLPEALRESDFGD
jgi:hypothetical protein